MRRVLFLALVTLFLATGAHAQQRTVPQQEQQQETGAIIDAGTMRTMHQEMLRGMSGLMERMNEMMEHMGRMVETASPVLLQEMAQIMTEMSITLQDMAEQRATGAAFSTQLQELQERMREMHQMMDGMEKQTPNP